MKNLVVIIFLISGSVLFGQNSLEQIIGVSGLRKFVNDSCSCKSVVETKYEYRFLGLKKKSRSFKKQYMKGLLVDNNGFEINYDSSQFYTRQLINSPNINLDLDTTIKVFFDYNNPDGKKGGPFRDYYAIFNIKEGLVISKKNLPSNYELFFEYNSSKKVKKVYSLSKKHDTIILQEYKYDSSNILKGVYWRNMFDGPKEIHSIVNYYNLKANV